MTVILNLPVTGVPKRTILDMAFESVGLPGSEFDRSAEEQTAALRKLNAMMKEWPWSLARYNQPSYGVGLPEELSNIPGDAESAVSAELALRIAPGLGLTLSPEQRAMRAQTRAMFVATYVTIPTCDIVGGTPLGAGNRWSGRRFSAAV